MRGGRFFCVALPLILCLASLVLMLVVTLAGVYHSSLSLFTIDLTHATLDAADAKDILENIEGGLPKNIQTDIDNLDLNNININDGDLSLGDLLGSAGSSRRGIEARGFTEGLESRQTGNISLVKLGFAKKYEVTLWGDCAVSENNKRNCTKAEFDWAHKHLDLSSIESKGTAAGVKFDIPSAVKDAIKTFSDVNKYAEIVFIAAIVALAIEFLIGIFANCTRVISCLVWLFSGITTALVCGSAALATAMAGVVVGTLDGSSDFFGAKGEINTTFLALVWIAAACSIGASLFWIFTICCCKPESRSKHHDRDDSEKLLPRGGYAPLGEDHERSAAGFQNDLNSPPTDYQGPSYPRGVRSDLAYEPYSHRA